MRTRFLATDYFSAGDIGGGDLPLLSLPAPHLPSAASSGHLDSGIISRFSLDLTVSAEIDRLPFEGALSDFLSNVIPRFQKTSLDASSPELPALSGGRERKESVSQGDEIEASEKLAGLLYDEKEVERNSGSRSDSPLSKITEESKLQKGLLFEVVELDYSLRECVSSRGARQAGLCFEVPDIEIPMDVIEIEGGVTISYPYQIAKSICLVEEIPALPTVDQDCMYVHDDNHSPDGTSYHTLKLPRFEESEAVFELNPNVFMDDAFKCLLSNIEPWLRAEGDELVVNAEEILGSSAIDILDRFSGHAPSDHCLKHKQISIDSVLDMDIINLNDKMLLCKNSAMFPILSDEECSHLPCSISFQEVEVLDHSSQELKMFGNREIAEVQDMSECMLKEDIDPAGSFYESVISSELVLADAAFKSLPTPILDDGKAIKPVSFIFGDILNALKPHPLSASDEIYLDWHLLLEGPCNREVCYTYVNMVKDISGSMATPELQTTDEEVVATDFDFLDDPPERVNTLQCKEVPSELPGAIPQASDSSGNPAIKQILKIDANRNNNAEQMSNLNREEGSVLFKSMSQSSDLNFFLDVRRGSTKYCEDTSTKRVGSKATPVICLKEASEPVVLSKESFEQWDIVVHQFGLSDHILCLISDIQKTYLDILENCTELRRNISFSVANNFEFLSLSKQKLLDLITDRFTGQFISKDETLFACITLYAVKQLAYLLCFFGVHSAYQYISNLTRSIGNKIQALRSLESLIEDACRKAEKQIIESHPSLLLVEEILMSTSSQNGNKILIVAERIFWLPLNLKLTSLRIKLHEVKAAHKPANKLDPLDDSELIKSILEALQHSDCLLISHQQISASFPFNKFSIILECGGSYASPKLSSISPNLHGLPQVHFLKINMENHNQAKAFCEGCDVSQHLNEMEVAMPCKPGLQGSLNKHNLVRLLNFVPLEEKHSFISTESANMVDGSYDNDSISMDYSEKCRSMSSVISSFPNIVIIVNTQNFEKKMLISRRSSYQKILALEKGGAQVVERETNLPLDLILNAAVCLVWYEAGNLGDNKVAAIETSSAPMFIENIATNILMSLSFAFSGCIMIFEGESKFLAAIMESSDALYAAAASLDMNLQLFCSYMPESTDEIILSCIKNATRLSRGIFPAMPESETLGESFLTSFPSINPLAAHAILSCGGMLVEFLEWSLEHKIQAMGKYHISDESISLFGALCRYGELGESKSEMTECSSIDSDIGSEKVESRRKRQKFVHKAINGSSCVLTLNQSDDGVIEHSQASQLCQSRFLNVQDVVGKTESYKPSMNDAILDINRGLNTSANNNLDHDVTSGCDFFNEDFSKDFNEDTVDHNSISLNEKFPRISDDISFFRKPESIRRPALRSSLHTSRLAFSSTGHCNFPTSAEINSDTDEWTPQKIQKHSLEDKLCGWLDIGSNRDIFPVKHEENPAVNRMQGCRQCTVGPSMQEKVSPFYRNNIFPQMIQSSRVQQRPLWTVDFVNTVKKRRMHQQTLPCNTCLSCPGSLMSKDKYSKNRSPSIIESYRYQGSNQTKRTVRKKWSKGVKLQVNSHSDKREDSSLISSTWTPIDKRARQNLSFTRNGNEKQSKLVWRSSKSPAIGCSLKRRYRDEG